MNAETRICQNCKQSFVIEEEDFQFYQKIKVPPPTFCPECRLKRRMAFRNERALYKRSCDLCKKTTFSIYSQDKPFIVYCVQCWFSDRWDPTDYGKEIDFEKPFFAQFHELVKCVPRLALEGYQNERSPYTNFTWFAKDVYLSSSVIYSENIINSQTVYHSSDIVDGDHIYNSSQCYETINGSRCVRSKYLENSRDCLESEFLYDCAGCKSAFLSVNLRHKSYVIRNHPCSREEYEFAIKKIDSGSFAVMERLKEEFQAMKQKAPHRFALFNKVENATGHNILNSKNAFYCFDVENMENVRYVFQGLEIKDSMDLFGAGDHAELLYEGVNVGYKDSGVFFSSHTYEGMLNAQYCDYCRGSAYLFGCVGIRKREYCILNKVYSREEYERLIPKLIKHMDAMPYKDKKGRRYGYGEFFPIELSPWAHNETVAQELFSLTKEEALEQGYGWRDVEIKVREISMQAEDLPDHIKDVNETILEEIICCSHKGTCFDQCTGAFRITPNELQFYQVMKIPLPRLCPNCRHARRVQQRNPLKLWHRKCTCAGAKSSNGVYANTISHSHGSSQCPNEFETSYAPDPLRRSFSEASRPEIVYCESCYQAEVV